MQHSRPFTLHLQGKCTVSESAVHVSSTRKKRLNDVVVAVVGGNMKGGGTVITRMVHLSTTLKKEIHNLKVAVVA